MPTCCPTSGAPRSSQRAADAYHGKDGPLRVTTPNGSTGVLGEAFIEAGQQAGYPYTPDCNGAQQEGFGPTDRTTHEGKRWSTARGYLDPVRARPNLTIVTGALALEVLFDGKRATGVAYAVGGERRTAMARARGHPVRRRDQQPAIAAAVGHRPGRSCCAGSASRRSTTCRGSAPTSATIRTSSSSTPASSR